MNSKCDRAADARRQSIRTVLAIWFYTAGRMAELYDEGSFASAALVSIRGRIGCVVRQSALGSAPTASGHARRAGALRDEVARRREAMSEALVMIDEQAPRLVSWRARDVMASCARLWRWRGDGHPHWHNYSARTTTAVYCE